MRLCNSHAPLDSPFSTQGQEPCQSSVALVKTRQLYQNDIRTRAHMYTTLYKTEHFHKFSPWTSCVSQSPSESSVSTHSCLCTDATNENMFSSSHHMSPLDAVLLPSQTWGVLLFHPYLVPLAVSPLFGSLCCLTLTWSTIVKLGYNEILITPTIIAFMT
jgi:hypothetical protein